VHKAIFLDRDGVLNKAPIINGIPQSPKEIDDVKIISKTYSALKKLKLMGFCLVIITNQPDFRRGTTSKTKLQTLNNHIGKLTKIQNIYTCFHDDLDNCLCRKPKPGLILMAANDLNIKLSESYLIGDRWKDIEAAQNAGVQGFFIDYKYKERQPELPYIAVDSLYHAATYIENL